MKYGPRFLLVTLVLAFFALSSLTSQAGSPHRDILTKSTLKAKKLKVTVSPTSGQSGSTATVTVTGATPNGKTVRITIGGSGHSYDADSRGKIVTREVISGLVGDKVKIKAEDVSRGTYSPYPKGEAVYTITGVKKQNRLNAPSFKPGDRTTKLPLGKH